MSPGGHLLTTLAACAGSAFLTRDLPLAQSLSLTAGIAAGGFLIDVDHALDYLVFEGQRDLRPDTFLRYHLERRMKRVVLALHSYELFAGLGFLAWWLDVPALWGYLMGALMHLALDITFNGELTPKSISAFYSFTYRLAHRFDAVALLGPPGGVAAPERFWPAFFMGGVPARDPSAPPRYAMRNFSKEQGKPRS